MNKEPRISFLMPYRWLTEDKEFLGENLKRSILRFIGGQEALNELRPISGYIVVVHCQAYKPTPIPLTKAQLQKLLKPIFPNGKCIDFGEEYTQHKSRTMLPLLDFKIYF